MIRRARRRAVFILAVICGLLLVLQGRLFFLQVLRHRPFSQNVVYRWFEVSEAGLRGKVVDRNGGVIARSMPCYEVYAWVPGIKDRRELARGVFRLTGADPDGLVEAMRRDPWTRVAQDVRDPAILAGFRELAKDRRFRNLHLEATPVRIYPRGDLFSPVLGMTDWRDQGVSGLEQMFNDWLVPRAGLRKVQRDSRRTEMMDLGLLFEPAEAGETLCLTLDPILQQMAERSLEELIDRVSARSAFAIVAEICSGEILALAQRPAPRSGRPEIAGENALDSYRCSALQDNYRPGSTIKPLLLSLVLDRGGATLDEVIDCEHGYHRFGSRIVHDVDGGYGLLSIPEVLIKSSNIGMAKLVCRLVPADAKKGDPAFGVVRDHLLGMGFGSPVLGFPAEEVGILTDLLKCDRNHTLVSWSFGHEVAVTGVQMLNAVRMLINDGIRTPLCLVKSPVGVGLQAAAEPQRVISEETSRSLREILVRVIEQGGSKKYRPPGYGMGGKTGTADKEEDRNLKTSSMYVFAPALEPDIVVLMVADDPESGRFSSQIVGPTLCPLVGEILRHRGVPPDRPEELSVVASQWSSEPNVASPQ